MTSATADRREFANWPVIATGMAGVSMFNLAPLYLGIHSREFALDDHQTGWLMSAEIAGIAFASLLTLWLMRRIALHQIAQCGLIVIIAGNLVSLTINHYASLLALRFLIGLFGDGLAYCAAISTLARHPFPVRAFATLSFANMCFSGAALGLLPELPETVLRHAVLVLMIALGLVGLLVSARYPRWDCNGLSAPERKPYKPTLWHLAALAGLFAFAANLGAVWGFAERIGSGIGLPLDTTSRLLGATVFFQALGSLAAMLLGRHTPSALTLTIVLALQLTSLGIIFNASGPWSYFTGIALWGASWNFGIANLLAALTGLQDGPRATSLAPGVEALGVSAGPLLVSGMLSTGTTSATVLVGASAATLSVMLFLHIRQQAKPPPLVPLH